MMPEAENCKLAYLSARLGLGLYLIYTGGTVLWSVLQIGGMGAQPISSTPNLMPLYFLIPTIVVIIGFLLILDKHVRMLAMVIAVVSLAAGYALPAVVALGLIVFWQHNITLLQKDEAHTS